jgi:hypothetical protein
MNLLKIILKELKIGLIKMKTIEITIQELQAATRPNVYRNRKENILEKINIGISLLKINSYIVV